MAQTHDDAAATAGGDPPMPDEPMEVDEDLMTMLRELALRGRLTADMIREYTKHFVQPQNYCYRVLSTSSNARNSLYRQ